METDNCNIDHIRESVEKLGKKFGDFLDLNPLASRIYALLLCTEEKGYSLDELIGILQGSKSAFSNNLQLLTGLGYVKCFTKTGDRKRYYTYDVPGSAALLAKHTANIKNSMDTLKIIQELKQQCHGDRSDTSSGTAAETSAFLEEQYQIFKERSKTKL